LHSGLYITNSCLISRNKIIKNGIAVYEHPGSADSFFDKAYNHLDIAYPKFYKMDMLSKLGILASEILLKDVHHEKKYQDTETGLVLSNANSSLDVDLKYAKTMHAGASPALFVYTLPNIVIGEISIRHHFKGENAFFVFKHFNGNFIAEYVTSLFVQELVKNCICGWIDILKEDYRAVLFLVETDSPEKSIPFSADNMNQLNQADHG
jgi:hypothetical protein